MTDAIKSFYALIAMLVSVLYESIDGTMVIASIPFLAFFAIVTHFNLVARNDFGGMVGTVGPVAHDDAVEAPFVAQNSGFPGKKTA